MSIDPSAIAVIVVVTATMFAIVGYVVGLYVGVECGNRELQGLIRQWREFDRNLSGRPAGSTGRTDAPGGERRQ